MQMPSARTSTLTLALFLLLTANAANAEAPTPDQPPPPISQGKPRWEAGLVVGGGHLSDYPGAGESHLRSLVAPFVIYRGPMLNVDGEGIRGRLLNHPDLELDLAASGAFNARENEARAGMPGLDYLFGLGPQLVYKGMRAVPGSPTLHLKAKALFSTDFRGVDNQGASFEPELRWRFERFGGTPAALTAGVQAAWATRDLHGHFYDVDAAYAVPGRPAYRARSGYLGTELRLALSRRVSASLSWFVAVRAMSLHGAANELSPLLIRTTTLDVGAGLLWTPWRSRQLVPG
jgi:outer membrane protein